MNVQVKFPFRFRPTPFPFALNVRVAGGGCRKFKRGGQSGQIIRRGFAMPINLLTINYAWLFVANWLWRVSNCSL